MNPKIPRESVPHPDVSGFEETTGDDLLSAVDSMGNVSDTIDGIGSFIKVVVDIVGEFLSILVP